MKRKIISVLLALVLVLSFSFMSSLPVSAATGSVDLDKDFYKAGDTITVTVVDQDLNTNTGVQETYSVGVTSSTTEGAQSVTGEVPDSTSYTLANDGLTDSNNDGQYTTLDVTFTSGLNDSLTTVTRNRDGSAVLTINDGGDGIDVGTTVDYGYYPELVVLTEDGTDSSTFTGTIVLQDAAASVGDNNLQADAEGETITVYYADSSVPAQRTATATTDYTAPTYDSAITGDLATGGSSAKNKIYLAFTEAAVGLDATTVETTDFSVTNPARTVTGIADVGTNYIILTVDSDLPTDATPDVALVGGASIQDNAGNELNGTASATFATVGTNTPPTAITVTAPTNTADFTAALYDAAGTTELVAPAASTGDDLTTDTVVLSYSYAASTDYTVKVTAADEAGDYTLSDDGDPAGSGGPVSLASATLQHASDGLRPEVVSAIAEDTNDNGYLDKITLTMSEDLTSNNPTNTAFDVVDSASTALTEVSAAAGGATTTGTLSFTSSSDTVVVELSDNAGRTGVPTLTYTAGAATEVQDLASNVLATCTPTVTDAALPTVNTVSFIEGDNALEETLVVGFSEDIATVGATSDYEVLYDADGDFGTTGDQRTVTVNEVADGTGVEVELTIPDQSLQTDWGGKFKVTVVNPANVKDASENGINPTNADATSGAVAAFDTVAPEIIEFEAELGAKTATVKFSEGVYTNNDGTGALAVADDLAYTDVSADGVSAISDVSHIAGGEIAVVTLNAQATSTDIGSDTVAAKTVTAIYDKAGNAAGTATVAMADARDALSLVDSWNLVSIPKVASAGWDIASNAPDLVDIYIYDNGGWSSVSDANSLDAVFINANGPQELALSWTTDVQTAPPTKALEAGWNLVGANMDPPTETSVPVDQFLDSVSGSYSTVFSPGYNLISWTVVFSGSPGSQNVLSYEGYWLYMTAAGELAGRTT